MGQFEPANVDWAAARVTFETTPVTITELARSLGVDKRTARRHRDAEGWQKPSVAQVVRLPNPSLQSARRMEKQGLKPPAFQPMTIDINDYDHVQTAKTAVAVAALTLKGIIAGGITQEEIDRNSAAVNLAGKAVLLDRLVKGLREGDASIKELPQENPGKTYTIAVRYQTTPAPETIEHEAESA